MISQFYKNKLFKTIIFFFQLLKSARVARGPNFAALWAVAVITWRVNAPARTDTQPPVQTTKWSTANKNLFYPLPPVSLYLKNHVTKIARSALQKTIWSATRVYASARTGTKKLPLISSTPILLMLYSVFL